MKNLFLSENYRDDRHAPPNKRKKMQQKDEEEDDDEDLNDSNYDEVIKILNCICYLNFKIFLYKCIANLYGYM